MNISSLQMLIQGSRLLLAAEKTYWQANLPKMTPEQKERLEKILIRAKKIPWNDKVKHYFSLIGNAASFSFSPQKTQTS